MLCKRLIPCLDVHAGRVVKGVRFVDLRDAGDPVEAARAYDVQGADELVFLDITASHEEREIMLDVGRRTTGRDAVAWAREVEALGAGEILLTSMDRDGTGDGYDLELTRAVSEAVTVPVIASGGAGSLEDLRTGVIEGKADALLVASMFHFGRHTIGEAKAYLRDQGAAVRLEP